jgi:hypothetical protein
MARQDRRHSCGGRGSYGQFPGPHSFGRFGGYHNDDDVAGADHDYHGGAGV